VAGGFSLFGVDKTSGADGSVWTALVPGVWSFGQGRGVLVLGTRDGMVGCIFISANRWCEPSCLGVKASNHSQHGEKPSNAVSHPDLGVRHYCL